MGEFPSTKCRQCGIHLPGKSNFIQVFSKSYCEIIGDFYYGNDLNSFIKISTLASESGRLFFFWTKDPFFLPAVINMSLLSARTSIY